MDDQNPYRPIETDEPNPKGRYNVGRLVAIVWFGLFGGYLVVVVVLNILFYLLDMA
ncbi:MAG: hypothetical protein KDB00_00400 [Planctomycetales bacterium]|nr:hypothetical protein [Planctomycetales bacterium]